MRLSRALLYAVLTLVAAVGMCAAIVIHFPVTALLPLVVLATLTLVSENFAFELPVKGSVSLSFAMVYAALLLDGPLAGVICAIAGSMTLEEIRSRVPASTRVFNFGQLVLSAGAAGLAYLLAGGQQLAAAEWPTAINLPAALAAALAFYAANVTLVTMYMSAKTGLSFLEMLRRQGFLAYAASLVVLGLLGLMIAMLLAAEGWIGLVLLALPFMAARRTFRVYAELTEAYTSTVRSLVTAIEAKDPYTRGHSERVAVYARRLGERLGLVRPQLDLLERAALLHDVGKIGIELDTLSSPMQLTAEEVRLIRRHPALGSELVGDVEFLADIVPVIRHHHERYDGAGYPDGLAGEGIPALARLMAVADSYDAMTSNRAYRPAMTREQALIEIERVAGTQLDERMALQFTAMLRDEHAEVVSHGS